MGDAATPVADALPRDAGALGGSREGRAAVDFTDRAVDVTCAVDLAGESIAGEHSLAGTALAAPRQDNPQPLVHAADLKPALHPTTGQPDVVARAAPAYASRNNSVIATRDVLGIFGRLDGKYVNHHVPRRPRFLETLVGAVTFTYLVTAWIPRKRRVGEREQDWWISGNLAG